MLWILFSDKYSLKVLKIFTCTRYSCGSVSSICCVVECVVHPAHHTLPCLLLPRQDPSQPPRTAHALSNTGTGAGDTHGAGACCRRGGEVERSPAAVHPEQLIVTQARDNPPLRCSLASQSETLALFSQPTLLFNFMWMFGPQWSD